VAAGLATNHSNGVARARVTSTYSGSYKPRALLLRESKTRDAERARKLLRLSGGERLITAGKKGPAQGKMAGENLLRAVCTRQSTSAAWCCTRHREPTAKDALLSCIGGPAGLM
jgi:hypothetical protein